MNSKALSSGGYSLCEIGFSETPAEGVGNVVSSSFPNNSAWYARSVVVSNHLLVAECCNLWLTEVKIEFSLRPKSILPKLSLSNHC